MPQRAAPAAILMTVLSACARAWGPADPPLAVVPPEAWLRTDLAEYTVRLEEGDHAVDFQLEYTNLLGQAVAVPACRVPYRPALEKLVDGEWTRALTPVEPLCISPPLVIPPGETYAFSFELRAAAPGSDRWPQLEVPGAEGTYRLVWFVGLHDPAADTGVGDLLPLEQRASHAFSLRL